MTDAFTVDNVITNSSLCAMSQVIKERFQRGKRKDMTLITEKDAVEHAGDKVPRVVIIDDSTMKAVSSRSKTSMMIDRCR